MLYVAAEYGKVSETFIADLVAGLPGTGWDVTVVCQWQHAAPPPGVTLRTADFARLTALGDRLARRAGRAAGRDGGTWPRLVRAARRALAPVIAEVRPDAAFVDYGRTAALAIGPLAEAGVPAVVHFHGFDITKALTEPGYRESLPAVFDAAAALVTASEHMRRLLVLEGAPPDRCRVVRYEVRTDGVAQVLWEARRAGPPSVAFFGRLTPKKHPVALVEAFARARRAVPEARLTLIGDGEERTRVADRVRRLNLGDAVELRPGCPRAEGLAEVARRWVFAQHSVTPPSGDQEGFALSPAEAALLGLPVVSTWHNGIPEHVADGVTGFLVREYDFEAMGDRLAELLSDLALCERMGRAGRERVSALCPPGARAPAIAALLRDAAGGKHR